MFQLSSDEQFAFYGEEVMALANNEGAATGEVLRILTGFIPHDFESVYNSFYPMAQAIHSQAVSAEANNDTVSAREAYLRAATYYRGADFFLHANWSDPRIYSLWNQQLNDFDKAVAMLETPPENFTLKAYSPNVAGGEFDVIGRFFKAPGSGYKTPTILVGSGYDGSQEEAWHSIGIEILKHGYNFVSYEGPGQPTVRRQQNIGFIPDWWNVVTPVVDYLSNRSDVEMDRLALVGISFGGTLAPVAASREHRIKQVLAIDGLYSTQQVTEQQWPPKLVGPFKNGSVSEFNEYIRAVQANTTYPSALRWFIDQGLFAFNTHDPYDWFTRLGNITMNPEVVSNLTQPVFVAKGQDDTTTLNQPNIANNLLVSGRPSGKNLTWFHEFNTSLGAGEHTTIGAEAQQGQVVIQWLREQWY